MSVNVPALSSDDGLGRYLQEIRRFPVLQPEEEYMLAERFREHGDPEAAHKLVTSHLPNVEVRGFSGLTVNFLKEAGARVIIRGLRVVSDFDFELQMANANRAMEPQIETLMMMTSPNYSYLSSSLVRQVMHFGGNLEGFVPGPIIERLKQNYYK